MTESLDLPALAADLGQMLAEAPPAKPKPARGSIRAELAERLGDGIAKDMAASIQAALDSMKTEWIECEKCRCKTPFAIPNMYERVKAAQLVMSELEGKVGTHKEAPAVQKTARGDLHELTDEQLEALLEGETEEDDAD